MLLRSSERRRFERGVLGGSLPVKTRRKFSTVTWRVVRTQNGTDFHNIAWHAYRGLIKRWDDRDCQKAQHNFTSQNFCHKLNFASVCSAHSSCLPDIRLKCQLIVLCSLCGQFKSRRSSFSIYLFMKQWKWITHCILFLFFSSSPLSVFLLHVITVWHLRWISAVFIHI